MHILIKTHNKILDLLDATEKQVIHCKQVCINDEWLDVYNNEALRHLYLDMKYETAPKVVQYTMVASIYFESAYGAIIAPESIIIIADGKHVTLRSKDNKYQLEMEERL